MSWHIASTSSVIILYKSALPVAPKFLYRCGLDQMAAMITDGFKPCVIKKLTSPERWKFVFAFGARSIRP